MKHRLGEIKTMAVIADHIVIEEAFVRVWLLGCLASLENAPVMVVSADQQSIIRTFKLFNSIKHFRIQFQ